MRRGDPVLDLRIGELGNSDWVGTPCGVALRPSELTRMIRTLRQAHLDAKKLVCLIASDESPFSTSAVGCAIRHDEHRAMDICSFHHSSSRSKE
jgi:hypothetical protein